MKKLPKTTSKRSPCPVATTLDVVGDKWSLLIVRDIGVFGYHRNKEFQDRREGIPTNILAARLKSLQESGIIRKERYQAHPPRYEYHLTEAGKALIPVVGEMAKWSANNVAGIRMPKLGKAARP